MAVVCPMGVAAETPPLTMDVLKEALGAAKGGQVQRAVTLLDGAGAAEDTPVELVALKMSLLGKFLQQLGRPAQALERVGEGIAFVEKQPQPERFAKPLEAMYGQAAVLRRTVWRPDHGTFLKGWYRSRGGRGLDQLAKAALDMGETDLAKQWAGELAAAHADSYTASQLLFNALWEGDDLPAALKAAEKMKALAGEPVNHVRAAISTALVWVGLGYSGKALAALENLPVDALPDAEKGLLLHTRSLALTQDGRTLEALRGFREALTLTESAPEEIRSVILAEQARTFLTLGRFGEAYGGYTGALALNPPFSRQLAMLTARGVVLERQGFPGQALSEHRQVAALAARSGFYQRAAVAMNNVSTAAREGGDLSMAMRWQWGALWVDDLRGDLTGKAVDYENIARLWLRLDRPALAHRYVQKARRTQQEADYLLQLRFGRTEGEACRRGGHFTCAKQVFGETIHMADAAGALDTLWMAQAGLARTHRDEGDLSRSAELFEEAIDTIEAMRDVTGDAASEKAHFLLERLPVYQDLLRVYLQQGRAEEAFTTLERMRARTLLDRLRQSGSRLDEEMTPQQQQREQALELAVKEAFQTLNETRTPDARTAYEKAKVALEDYRRELDRDYPKLAFFRGRGGKPSPYLVANYLRPGDAMVLQHTDDEGTVLFLITPDDFQVVTVDRLKREQLAMLVRDRLRTPIATGVWDRVQERTAQALYQVLLAPLLGDREVTALLFSPDETLAELPLGVLMDGEGSFLAQHLAILTVPSATTWTYARSIRGAPDPKAQWLVLANPVFADDRLAPLAGTEQEAKTVQHLYSQSVALFTREQATESHVFKEGDRSALLHFATHGLLDPHNPMHSRVALARDPGAGNDGFLEVREIMGLDLRASLVVLSACDSARGQALAGEGLQGLAQAFLRAGAPRVMATLWEVNDQSTSFLVRHFYENMKTMDVAQALRKAQDAARQEFGGNPFFWAPFVLLGPGWEGDLTGEGGVP